MKKKPHCDCCLKTKKDLKIMYAPIGESHLRGAVTGILGVNFVKVPVCISCRTCEECTQEMTTSLTGKWEENIKDPNYIIINELDDNVDIEVQCGC